MRYFFLLFLCIYISAFAAKSSIVREFPSSEEEVALFTDDALKNFDQELTLFIEQPLQERNFSTVICKWSSIVGSLFAKGAILSFLPLIVDNVDVIAKGDQEMKKITQRALIAMQDPKVLSLILAFLKKTVEEPNHLESFQFYLIDLMLRSISNPSYKEDVALIQSQISKQVKLPFSYIQGEKKDKALPKKKSFTIANWNVCLFDANLSMLFGGVLPWKDRIDRICAKIKKLNPDILCLQEVFSQEAGNALVDQLKPYYAHFYTQIGPKPAGFSLETLGIPSGLFIASKYPLKNATFTPYVKGETPSYRGYGFFSADIYSKNLLVGHLISTHLQPGCSAEDANYRIAQMRAIDTSLQNIDAPTFLCGDFNIEKTSKEAELFHPYEFSLYQGINWTCCELRDYWWKAKQNIENFSALPLVKEWLDYFFCFNKTKKHPPRMQTEVQIVNDLSQPQDALSDHQLLLTKIEL
jgi:endonuclease/exonuclease/phosphatase family metal-dependent hydrolase